MSDCPHSTTYLASSVTQTAPDVHEVLILLELYTGMQWFILISVYNSLLCIVCTWYMDSTNQNKYKYSTHQTQGTCVTCETRSICVPNTCPINMRVTYTPTHVCACAYSTCLSTKHSAKITNSRVNFAPTTSTHTCVLAECGLSSRPSLPHVILRTRLSPLLFFYGCKGQQAMCACKGRAWRRGYQF